MIVMSRKAGGQILAVLFLFTLLAPQAVAAGITEDYFFDKLRMQYSDQIFGHTGATWDAVKGSDSEPHRQRKSQTRFGHTDGSWDDIIAHDKEEMRKRLSMQNFEHPNASWDDIVSRVSREENRKRFSFERFRHEDATWEEILKAGGFFI